MAARRALTGDRPPAYPSKATLAAELDMSESTVDDLTKRGLLPKPIKLGGSLRWCWAAVDASMKPQGGGEDDKFMAGLKNV
ncbi:phage transcriptional regulator, AlpA [Rhodobacter ferrooxidans]|uniref:Phage transcriptional regulator, AlpA n=2 Tax=Rhodobacter ferrooxidans TaxID=371731 RepID=C8S4W1_9RHOB|nr:phage transcriptional regulator, AlpA [Rhodobacter sp. SW2]